MTSKDAFRVSFRPLADHPNLASQWHDLSSRADCSFFLTWPWIGAWLERRPASADVRVLLAHAGERLVGAALVGKSSRRIAGVPICEAWHLHATGDAGYDSICMEHNDFLIDRDHGDDVRAAMLAAWSATAGRAAELHLPGVAGGGWSSTLAGNMQCDIEVKNAAGVSLAPVRDAKLDFTPLLSSHARRFVRRSMKEYQTLGPLAVDEAATLPEALDFLAGLVRLHEAVWHQRGRPGAFAAAGVMPFHHRLIELALPDKAVQLLRVRAGDAVIGYLYGFVRGQRVYVYQSGFDYALLEKHGRPGLVTHTLAIQYNAGLGHDYYDLLAGESQYKATISTSSEPVTWSVWKKPALRFAAERLGRETVRRWRDMKRERNPPAIVEASPEH